MDIKLEKKPPVQRYKYLIAGAVLLGLLLVYLLFTTVGPSRLRYDKENVRIATVVNDKFIEYLDVESIAKPKLTLRLNSLENGIVKRIVAEEGTMLAEGDTILVLENPELLRVIEDEKDELDKQRVSYQEKILQMQRRSSELKRNALKTVYELERQNKQYALDKEEYEIGIKSKAQLEVASDDYNFKNETARLQLEELRHDSLMNVIQTDLMKNDLLREEKRYARSRARVDNLIVRAPVSGQLSYISVIPGERVSTGSGLGEIKGVDDLKLTTLVSEYYIERVSIGLAASLTYQNKKYDLRVTKINPEVKERNFEIDLAFVNEIPENTRIGKTYRVQIELGQSEDALVVDKGNFYSSTGGQWVFKLNAAGNKATRQPVTIGRQNPRQYEILDGLKAGEQVIISGYNYFENAQELILK
ncbi:MAG: HlyD family efflux transporter periplasmic adaptor subunit [Odoribacteraceae bacterium]|jgi:RND family efflux transporter MFP subunit|nr:HlyD family efflux transporter periplasmic adaptor subunit [Odoribacteraceae bacterium]